MASRNSKPNRGGGGGGRHNSNSNFNSRQSFHSRNQQPQWRERNNPTNYEDDGAHSNNSNSNSRGFTLSNTATEYYSYHHHYSQQQLLHYAQPQEFYYYPSYAPLQHIPPPAAATHYYNSSSTVQTAAPLPLRQRPPFIQPQNTVIQSRKSLGKVFRSEEQNARSAGQASEPLVSLMENMEINVEPSTSSSMSDFSMDVPHFPKLLPSELDKNLPQSPLPLVAIRRPDQGGKEGPPIRLLANHFLVEFEPSQQIFHYDMEISPPPSKEVARHLKRKLVAENSSLLSNALPAFDGRKNLYSAVEFQKEKMELYVSLPMRTARGVSTFDSNTHLSFGSGCEDGGSSNREKLFKVSIKIASKLDGKELNEFLKNKEDHIALPQDFIQALDVVLRENPTEKCFPVSRSLYSSSMGSEVIGGGAVGLRGFFQSLRATQQGLALNVDFSVTAFHESIGIIPYLQKRCEFLHDLPLRKSRMLSPEEKNEVEKALKNMRVFVCHRATDQRYKVHSLTDGVTDVLTFKERDGKVVRVVDYFKDHYNHEIEYINLPCLQISRSKPCYLPMELCIICEGQKYLGKLSDDQTAKILRMGCQKPRERKAIIKGVLGGAVGPR
ncbi:hypothetical protein KI387_022390, partial [Taxus chinensis]